MKKIINEFKTFIMRGNVVDLAVGVVMGGAFSKIVTSLVNDIMMPIIGVIIGGLDFTSLSINVGSAKIMYGSFIQNIIDFLIIAACIFLFVKIINKLIHKKEEKAPVDKPSEEVLLLREIRDSLKGKNSVKTKKASSK